MTRRLLKLLSCIRLGEVMVLQGSPALGAVFALGPLTGAKLPALGLLLVGNACLVAHVFLLNDWAGLKHDLQDPNRSAQVFVARGIQPWEVGALALVLLALALATLAPLGPTPLALALLIAGASALYSLPPVCLKVVPIASSLLHLVTGVMHFLVGYTAFRGLDARGVEVGLFFALIFCAGHLTQEVRDHGADTKSGLRTNAARFGKEACFAVAFVLFTLADALLVGLARAGLVPAPLAVAAALVYALHGLSAVQALRSGLTPASVRQLQGRYRWLYAGLGAVMVVCLLGTPDLIAVRAQHGDPLPGGAGPDDPVAKLLIHTEPFQELTRLFRRHGFSII